MVSIYPLMTSNVGNREAREKNGLLVYGSCVSTQFPDLFNEVFDKYQYPAFHVCLESVHMNMAGYKLASFIAYSHVQNIVILTVDGSPHCIQLHYLVEDLKQHFTPDITTTHYVIDKGKLYEISERAIKKSRHLHTIEKMMKNS